MNPVAAISNAVAAVRAGRELTNAAGWKQVQNVINLISALVALAAALGYPLPVTVDGIYALAGGLVAVANVYLTVATSAKIGLLPAKPVPIDEPPSITQVSRADPAGWMRQSAVPPDREHQPEPADHGHNS
jgi:hypothetical protein